QIGLAEAAVETGALDLQPEKREVAETYIKLRLGVAVEVAPLGANAFGCSRLKLSGAANQRDARIGEGIALAWLADEQRAARIGKDRLRVGRKLRDEDERRAVRIGRHPHPACQRHARVRIEDPERAKAGRAGEGLCESHRL